MNVIDTNRMRNITLNYDYVPKSKRSDIKRLIINFISLETYCLK